MKAIDWIGIAVAFVLGAYAGFRMGSDLHDTDYDRGRCEQQGGTLYKGQCVHITPVSP